MSIFNSYVKLPEGNTFWWVDSDDVFCPKNFMSRTIWGNIPVFFFNCWGFLPSCRAFCASKSSALVPKVNTSKCHRGHWQTLRICSALVLSCAKCWLAGIHFTLPTWMMHSLFRPGILIVETLGAGVAKLNHATHSTIQRSSSSSSPPAPAPLLPAVDFLSPPVINKTAHRRRSLCPSRLLVGLWALSMGTLWFFQTWIGQLLYPQMDVNPVSVCKCLGL